MYVRTDVLERMYQEKLGEAQQAGYVQRVSALNRASRREARAERRMSRARVQATRLRRQLEAEL
jgi:hypothetical protein